MSAKQGHNRNQIRRVCLYAILSAVCLCLGYLESLVPLTFIAPGVKIGLANTVCLILAAKMDIKGAFFVNTVRILLSGFKYATDKENKYNKKLQQIRESRNGGEQL